MAAFYDALHRGDLAPEAVEGVLRDVLDDPRLTVLYSLPAFDGNVDGTGTSVQRAAGDLLPVEWDGQRLGVVRCGPLGEQASRRAGWHGTWCVAPVSPWRCRGCGSSCARS
jgi:hypothetical protein